MVQRQTVRLKGEKEILKLPGQDCFEAKRFNRMFYLTLVITVDFRITIFTIRTDIDNHYFLLRYTRGKYETEVHGFVLE